MLLLFNLFTLRFKISIKANTLAEIIKQSINLLERRESEDISLPSHKQILLPILVEYAKDLAISTYDSIMFANIKREGGFPLSSNILVQIHQNALSHALNTFDKQSILEMEETSLTKNDVIVSIL